MKLQDPEVDVTTLEYIPSQCDDFRRKVVLEHGNEVEVLVWDTAGYQLNPNQLIN